MALICTFGGGRAVALCLLSPAVTIPSAARSSRPQAPPICSISRTDRNDGDDALSVGVVTGRLLVALRAEGLVGEIVARSPVVVVCRVASPYRGEYRVEPSSPSTTG